MASILILLLTVYAAIAAANGLDAAWIGGVMITLAAVYPAYMGANAAQKVARAKAKEPKQ